jgi:site-specific recombinase XerD
MGAEEVPHGELLEEHARFLQVHRGLAPRTILQRTRWCEALLRKLAERRPTFRMEELTSQAVEDAVADLLRDRVGTPTQRVIISAVEVFVRHLRASGRIPPTCRPFFPRRRRYALATLPTALHWDQVNKALGSIDRTSCQGHRDYAMFLMYATYGLRTGDLVGLELDDIDWRRGEFRVKQRKTRRELRLPLVQPVVDALAVYLRHARPQGADRHVFQKVRAPRGPITCGAAYHIVGKTLLRAGIDTPRSGPTVLRHSRATSLVRQGRRLKVIGDLLGHRVPETTLVYCKLAVEDLRDVALDLPEVPQ